MKKTYALGLDFGSLSARAVLLDTDSGATAAGAEYVYPHAVMDKELPDGTPLPRDYALQHPADYLEALYTLPKRLLAETGADPKEIAGVGVDFTASTVLPLDVSGTPLALTDAFRTDKHAYVKMWKHHAAAAYAEKLLAAAKARGENFLSYYSDAVSGEWLFPKLWQILDEDPELYEKTACFIEAGDFMVKLLTGNTTRSACFAGYKALWNAEDGFPSKDFLACLDERLQNAVEEKLYGKVLPLGAVAGVVTPEAAAKTGLAAGTPVATAVIDAHAAFPASGITGSGRMLLILGTSSVEMLVDEKKPTGKGVCGVVKDGILAGFYGCETGQTCAGDHFDWLVNHFLPAAYENEAKTRGISIHELLSEKAAKKRPGETGLLALDWWNGCRTDLMDDTLTGALVGMTLSSRAEDIYRALVEATAYGIRLAVDVYERAGVRVSALTACGGMANKNPFLMQIYADVLGRPIDVLDDNLACARGSAMYGAVAGSVFADMTACASRLAARPVRTYTPEKAHTAVYDQLYALYLRLHDEAGRAGSVMKTLRTLQN